MFLDESYKQKRYVIVQYTSALQQKVYTAFKIRKWNYNSKC